MVACQNILNLKTILAVTGVNFEFTVHFGPKVWPLCHTCIHTCTRTHTCICTHTDTHISIYLSIYLSIYHSIYLSMCLYLYLYLSIYIFISNGKKCSQEGFHPCYSQSQVVYALHVLSSSLQGFVWLNGPFLALVLALQETEMGVVIYMYFKHSPDYIESKYIWVHGLTT